MRLLLQVFILLIFTAVCLGAATFGEEDACPAGRHTVLSETYRSTGYDTRPSDTPKCDKNLKGWYRFTGLNGESADMPTTCPGTNACGTTTPLWMDGTFPDISGDIVSRRLCGKLSQDPNADCCEFKDQVFVKNCTGFYIYYLGRQVDCPIGYCAGSAKRCPAGTSSSTGFEPCKKPGVFLDKPPTVSGVNVHADGSFDFVCKFEYADNDPSNVFEVTWTFNGQSDSAIPTEVLTGGTRSATLTSEELKNHIDAQIGCQVVTYYKGQENKKNIYLSEKKLFGVQTVKLLGPTIVGDTFKFECVVNPAPDDAEQKIEVAWTFDGAQDPNVPPRILTGQRTVDSLDGSLLKGHLNSVVGCQARLIYDESDIKTTFSKSNTYFAGIKVTPGKLDISATEGEKHITVTSTIPIVCEQSKPCCLTFTISIDNTSVVSLKNTCGYKLCSSDWNDEKKQASITITVVPSRNFIAGGTRNAILIFGEVYISSICACNEVFIGCRLPPVVIIVIIVPGDKCCMTGDPHIKAFDYKVVFDLYKAGDYTAVQVKDRDFKVHIRTRKCFKVACICGIVVKENNDIIRVFGCDKKQLFQSSLEIPYALSAGASVQRSGDGRRIGIVLSSGSEIKVELAKNAINVYLTLPGTDKGKAVGICGTNDGRTGNDFTKPDGSVVPVCKGRGRCIPVAFTESWRVNGDDSMLQLTPEKVVEPPPTEFCSCTTDSVGKPSYTCSPRQQHSDLTCPRCQEVTKDIEIIIWGEKGQTPVLFPDINTADPNKNWPNDEGVTEVQAKDLCNKALRKSLVYNLCKNEENLVQSVTEECMGDILFGGTTDAVNLVTASFTSKCQLNLASDENNYERGPDGSMKLKPDVIDLVCPLECLDNGKCQAGMCVCNAGWTGETCLIDISKGPQISFVPGRKGCMSRQFPCDTVVFDKSNVNILDKLKCRVHGVNDKGETIGIPVVTEALTMSSSTVICPIPMTTLRRMKILEKVQNETIKKYYFGMPERYGGDYGGDKGFNIARSTGLSKASCTQVSGQSNAARYAFSISTDGATFGNELLVIAIPDSCVECSETACTEKADVCIVNGFCYDDGELNPKNVTEICDVEKSTIRWSLDDEEDTETITSKNNAKPNGKHTKDKPRRPKNRGKGGKKSNNTAGRG